MPAESTKQANFMKLAYYLKKHGKLPEGAGKPSAAMRSAAHSMTSDQLHDYMTTKKKAR